jgi:hypothetical protein
VASPSRTKPTASRLAIAERERDALELRKSGASFDVIAREIGYAGRDGAWRAVSGALRETLQQPADELRRLESERLDALLAAVWPAAMEGKRYAIECCLRIMDRRARLLGLDEPVKRVVDVVTREAFLAIVNDMNTEFVELEAVLRDETQAESSEGSSGQ